MTRAEVLRDLVARRRRFDATRLHALADELDLPLSDIFVVAGHPVPAHLLPPDRDRRILREFAYRVTRCDHARLATLEGFVSRLVSTGPAPPTEPREEVEPPPPSTDEFGKIFAGLLRNRGFGLTELPFTGLSRTTIRGMMDGTWYSPHQLKAMSGPLGWRYEDLVAVAGEPLGDWKVGSVLCHHVGRVYAAAIPLTTEQLIEAAIEADRLSEQEDPGYGITGEVRGMVWQPWVKNLCPVELTPETDSDQP
jgi:hypothetical protein